MKQIGDFKNLSVWSLVLKLTALMIITFVVFGIIYFTTDINNNFLNHLFFLTVHLLIILLIVRSFNKHRISITNVIGDISLRNEPWLQLIGIKILLIFYSMIAIVATIYTIGQIDLEIYTSIFFDDQDQRGSYEATILGIVASFTIVPIMEELLFRGYLLNKWGESKGLIKAIFFSSLLFSILHMDTGFIAHFVSGIFYSFVYLKTRKLMIPILLHGFNNFIAVGFRFLPSTESPFEGVSLEQAMKELEMVLGIGTIIFLVLTPIVCYILYRYYRSVPRVTPYQGNSSLNC